MKPIDIKFDCYAEYNVDSNEKILNFKLVIMKEYQNKKNIVAKEYSPNWSEEVFVISKIKNTVPWTYVNDDLNGEEIVGTFYEIELQETNQEEFRMEKVIKKRK